MRSFFIVIQYIGIAALLLEASYVVRREPSRQKECVLALIAVTGLDFVGYLLNLSAMTQGEALVAQKIMCMSEPFVVLFLFLFVMHVCRISIPKWMEWVLVYIHVLIMFAALTCDRHILFFRDISFTEEGLFPHLVVEYGVIYYLFEVLMFLYVILMVTACIVNYKKSRDVTERKILIQLLLINAIAFAGNAVYISGITQGYNTEVFAYFINVLILWELFFKNKILDMLVWAKDIAVDSMAEGLVITDNNGKIIYYNKAAEQIYGEVLSGKPNAVAEVLEDMDCCILEQRNIVRNRRYYAVNSCMVDRDNTYYGKMYVLSDITDSYHYTESVKERAEIMWKLKEQAESANAAKSAFLSNMSHEIRTPMNAVVGLTDVLLRKERDMEEKRYLLNIKSSGKALLDLINDLLDFSKIEAGKFDIVDDTYDLAQLLRDIQVIGNTRIGDKNIKLIMDIDEEIPRLLYGDALRIRQVIINIMNNAIKFTEEGSVTITVKQQEREEKRVCLYISVKDTGQGIRQQDLEHLFDAFAQVDQKKNKGKEGTGLGLAISRQLVELMKGRFYVTSEYGKGSEFYFILWEGIESDEKIGDFSEIKEMPENEEKGLFTFTAPEAEILLVDDNEINREVAIALLEPFEMRITAAGNGQEALDLLRDKKYDLVFMDHYMPVLDGVEATKRIRAYEEEYYHNLPILALTADAVQGVKEEFFAVGMNDFISKPISMEEIAVALKRWLPKEKIHIKEG